MTIDSARLLRKLEPPVRPVASRDVSAAPTPFERRGFDELLSLVSRGSVSSGRSVQFGPEATMSSGVPAGATGRPGAALEPAQLERLAAAADLAESSGVARAVMLMDGRGYVMDVPQRMVSAELSAETGHRLIDVEAAVYVAGPDDETPMQGAPLPGTGLVPPAIAQQLAAAHPPGAGHDAPRRAG